MNLIQTDDPGRPLFALVRHESPYERLAAVPASQFFAGSRLWSVEQRQRTLEKRSPSLSMASTTGASRLDEAQRGACDALDDVVVAPVQFIANATVEE